MENFKEILSQNLVLLRKNKKLTQSELAEVLNYSDKTISKWENGDAIPDVETLIYIASFYNVSIDSLVSRSKEEITKENNKETAYNARNKIIITLLSISLVWLLATIVFVNVLILNNFKLWIIYIWAIPVSFVVLLIFNAIWGKRFLTFGIISCLIWTLLLSMHLQFRSYNLWSIYFLGIPLQVATILWSQLKTHSAYQHKKNK